MRRFEFATAQRIIFGSGARFELGDLAKALGHRPLVVTGKDTGRHAPLLDLLRSHGMQPQLQAIPGEPTIQDAERGSAHARSMGADLIIGIGGGSALDGAKAIAALAANAGGPLEYLEVIGQGHALEHPSLPCIAIPTTAGTGSEVTRNAVLASPDHGVKVSLRHAGMLPRVALVDPELTLGLPSEITASTGLDALTQLIEPYLSSKANPMTDALCLEGIRRVARSLLPAWKDGSNLSAREDMALASLFGGMALANAGLGAVHGLAAPLGGLTAVPHGNACAALLPWVMEANWKATSGDDAMRSRFQMVARTLTGKPDAKAEEGVSWVQQLVRECQIPRLRQFGMTAENLDEIAEKAMVASSMKANPVPLDKSVLIAILTQAM